MVLYVPLVPLANHTRTILPSHALWVIGAPLAPRLPVSLVLTSHSMDKMLSKIALQLKPVTILTQMDPLPLLITSVQLVSGVRRVLTIPTLTHAQKRHSDKVLWPLNNLIVVLVLQNSSAHPILLSHLSAHKVIIVLRIPRFLFLAQDNTLVLDLDLQMFQNVPFAQVDVSVCKLVLLPLMVMVNVILVSLAMLVTLFPIQMPP